MRRTVEKLVNLRADYITVWAVKSVVAAALKAVRGSETKILTVGALTSAEKNPALLTAPAARLAAAVRDGAAGIIAAPELILSVRDISPNPIITATPGIKFTSQENYPGQKWSSTVEEVIQVGGDYLIAGRIISTADNPEESAKKIIREIEIAQEKSPILASLRITIAELPGQRY